MTEHDSPTLAPAEILECWLATWADKLPKGGGELSRESFLKRSQVHKLTQRPASLVRFALTRHQYLEDVEILVDALNRRGELDRVLHLRSARFVPPEELFLTWLGLWHTAVPTDRRLTVLRDTFTSRSDVRELAFYPEARVVRALKNHQRIADVLKALRKRVDSPPPHEKRDPPSRRPPRLSPTAVPARPRRPPSSPSGIAAKKVPRARRPRWVEDILGGQSQFTSGGGAWMSKGQSQPERGPVERCSACGAKVPDGAQHDCG